MTEQKKQMDTIPERIKRFNSNCRTEDILEMKYSAMGENVFRFFRGTCHIFYEDLHNSGFILSSPNVWICGDLHLENFGSYKSDNRLVYFDLNDFDEAMLAPAHWEILRILTSIFVAFDSLNISKLKAEKLSQLFIKHYADTLKSGKAVYIERQTAQGIVFEFLKNAGNRDHKHVMDKKTLQTKKHNTVIVNDPRHLPVNKPLKKAVMQHMQHWIRHDENSPYNYEVIDCAFRVAGTGSLGLKRFMLLLKSSNHKGSKHILLDMKQTCSSSLLPYLDITQPSWQSDAERIIEIQTRMQNRPPALLSTTIFQEEHYVVQELRPERDNVDFKLLKNRYRDMCRVIIDMATLTASAQLRSSGRQGSAIADELIAFGQDEAWQKTVVDYASQYASQVKNDYKEFKRNLRKFG